MFQKELKELRNGDIFKMHLEGKTLQYIGSAYQLSIERVRQITRKFFRVLSHPKYKEMLPYPFPREKAPHLWRPVFPGTTSKLVTLERRFLKPEEKEIEKNYWLTLLAKLEEENGVKALREILAYPRCDCGNVVRYPHLAGVDLKCEWCGVVVPMEN